MHSLHGQKANGVLTVVLNGRTSRIAEENHCPDEHTDENEHTRHLCPSHRERF